MSDFRVQYMVEATVGERRVSRKDFDGPQDARTYARLALRSGARDVSIAYAIQRFDAPSGKWEHVKRDYLSTNGMDLPEVPQMAEGLFS